MARQGGKTDSESRGKAPWSKNKYPKRVNYKMVGIASVLPQCAAASATLRQEELGCSHAALPTAQEVAKRLASHLCRHQEQRRESTCAASKSATPYCTPGKTLGISMGE